MDLLGLEETVDGSPWRMKCYGTGMLSEGTMMMC